MTTTSEKIIALAERYIRDGGYNSFSFRDIAAEIGIKSASVHYHFPTKEALGAAVADRYTENVLAFLGDPMAEDASQRMLAERYVALYRGALVTDQQMCLCGLLGAEQAALPEPVKQSVRGFFSKNQGWLEQFFTRFHPGLSKTLLAAKARHAVASMQGALMMACANDDNAIFEDVAREVVQFMAPDPD